MLSLVVVKMNDKGFKKYSWWFSGGEMLNIT